MRPVGQSQSPLGRVLDQIKPVQAAVHVLGLGVVTVVVVPQRRAALLVRVVVKAVAAGGDDVHRVPIAAGWDVPAVQVHVRRFAQVVGVPHDDPPAGPCLNGGPVKVPA